MPRPWGQAVAFGGGVGGGMPSDITAPRVSEAADVRAQKRPETQRYQTRSGALGGNGGKLGGNWGGRGGIEE